MVKVVPSLRGQLIVVLLTIVALGLGLLLIVVGSQVSRMTMEESTREQQMMALTLANIFSESFETPRAQQIITAWLSDSDRWKKVVPPDTNVSLFNTQGMLIASSASASNHSLSVDLRPVLSGAMVSSIVDGRLYTAVPALDEGRSILGVVQIDSSLDSVNMRIFSQWLALIGATGAALLLAFVVAFGLASRLTHPLARLRRVAQQMAEGQLDSRLEIGDTVNELASLGSAFNDMAERIERMVQEQRDFIANASHELRSPLSVMKLHAEALVEQPVNSDRARQYATEINDDVSQVTQLVNNVFQLSRRYRLAEKESVMPPVRDPFGDSDRRP